MENEIYQVHKTKRIYQTYLRRLMWYFSKISILNMRTWVKKQQSQAQTVQRTVTSRNITLDNSNINKFWKGRCWFAVNAGDLFYFLGPDSRKRLFGKLHLYLSIQTQSNPIRPSVLHSLHALPVVVLAIPANSSACINHTKSTNHTVN